MKLSLWLNLVGMLLAAACAGYASPVSTTAAATDPYATIRANWLRSLLGDGGQTQLPEYRQWAEGIAHLAGEHRRSMNKDVARTTLWADTADPTNPALTTRAYGRLKVMAIAYRAEGSSLKDDPALKRDLVSALEWLYEHRYNEKTPDIGNWYEQEIGTPLALNDVTLLLYEQLGPKRVERYMKVVAALSGSPYANTYRTTQPRRGYEFTGANRVWRCAILAEHGALMRDARDLATARDALADVFADVKSGEGFYADGSFLAHEHHPYTGGYGISLLSNLGRLGLLLQDSPWKLPDPEVRTAERWINESFVPLIFRGAMMDMVRGREIARPQRSDHAAGRDAIRAMLQVSELLEAASQDAIRPVLKGWIEADRTGSVLDGADAGLIGPLHDLVTGRSVSPVVATASHRRFPAMDRVVHRRSDFAVGLAMNSRRTFNFEYGNGENGRGWFTAEGALYRYDGDLTQFADGFWPTVDSKRIPGTTVERRPHQEFSFEEASKLGTHSWVGGTEIDGLYGASGMAFAPRNSSLRGKKSWFFFDHEVVALGAGISSEDDWPVETIVENRKVGTESRWDVNGTATGAASPSETVATDVTAAHLTAAAGSSTGYVFPVPIRLHVLREARNGSWADINRQYGTHDPLTREYVTVWIDHGRRPSNDRYAYILLPNRSYAETLRYAQDPGARILENSDSIQAVSCEPLRMVAANFWSDSGGAVGGLRCDRPASVMARATDMLELAISDPTWECPDSIQVEWSRAAGAIVKADPEIQVIQLDPVIRISVAVRGAMGRTRRVTFSPAR